MIFISTLYLCILLLSYQILTKPTRNLQSPHSLSKSINLQKFCSQISRNDLYDEFGQYDNIQSQNMQIGNLFQMNTSIINKIIQQDYEQVKNIMIQKNEQYFIYCGAWIIGIIVTFFLIPFLYICFLYPQHKITKDEQFNRIQFIWPTIVVVTLLSIILITTIIGISSSYKSNIVYKNLVCSVGVIFQDLLYGQRSYYDKSIYFSGINTIQSQLRTISQNLDYLNNQISKLQSSYTQIINIKSLISTCKTSTSSIPSISQNLLQLSYNSPLQSSTQIINIPSTFPLILGNKLLTTSLVGGAYLSIVSYENIVNMIIQSADNYENNMQEMIKDQINKAMEYIGNNKNIVIKQDQKISQTFTSYLDFIRLINILQYVLYSLILAVSILLFIIIILIIKNYHPKLIMILKGIIIFLFIMCIICFSLCILISIINPLAYYTCQFINQNLKSRQKLSDTLINKFNVSYQNFILISECILEDGKGSLINNVIPEQTVSNINIFMSVSQSLSNLTDIYKTTIKQVYQLIKNTVVSYKKAQIIDIVDFFGLYALNKISKPNSYTCLSNGFTEDSWIPSINQKPNYINCQINTTFYSNSSNCMNYNDFTSRLNGCKGCMDTYDILKNNLTAADVKNALNARYPSFTCTTFTNQLSNIWNNFYKKKITVLEPVQNRAILAQNDAYLVTKTMQYFTDIQKNISSYFPFFFDNQNNLINGLNCKVIKQDVRLIKKLFCKNVNGYLYFLRTIFGIISIVMSFLLCFLIFFIRQNYRKNYVKNPKKNQILDQKNLQKKETKQESQIEINLQKTSNNTQLNEIIQKQSNLQQKQRQLKKFIKQKNQQDPTIMELKDYQQIKQNYINQINQIKNKNSIQLLLNQIVNMQIQQI